MYKLFLNFLSRCFVLKLEEALFCATVSCCSFVWTICTTSRCRHVHKHFQSKEPQTVCTRKHVTASYNAGGRKVKRSKVKRSKLSTDTIPHTYLTLHNTITDTGCFWVWITVSTECSRAHLSIMIPPNDLVTSNWHLSTTLSGKARLSLKHFPFQALVKRSPVPFTKS